MRLFRRVLQAASYSAGGLFGASVVALAVDAPCADFGDGAYEAQCNREQVFPTWLHDVGRFPVIFIVTAASKFYFNRLNTFKVHDVEHLIKALEDRQPGTAVITVSNHKATLDDPSVLACMLPWRFALPSKARWGLCSQEYSYTHGVLASTFFYSAKTLPVKRGAGIDHKMMEEFYKLVNDGKWVHIFPEGKIDQHEVLGGRHGPMRDRVGRLKWGVGKLIARAKERPIVIPFYHTNMEKIMPQNEKNQVISLIPKTNIDVNVRVGAPISFDDLFEKYAHDRIDGSTSPWQTQESERALYSAITRRIEDALLDLAKESSSSK